MKTVLVDGVKYDHLKKFIDDWTIDFYQLVDDNYFIKIKYGNYTEYGMKTLYYYTPDKLNNIIFYP